MFSVRESSPCRLLAKTPRAACNLIQSIPSRIHGLFQRYPDESLVQTGVRMTAAWMTGRTLSALGHKAIQVVLHPQETENSSDALKTLAQQWVALGIMGYGLNHCLKTRYRNRLTHRFAATMARLPPILASNKASPELREALLEATQVIREMIVEYTPEAPLSPLLLDLHLLGEQVQLKLAELPELDLSIQ